MGFPNDEQKQIINHSKQPLIVVAAPGTGKTRTIVARMEKLLDENPDREVSFITFTRSSRKDTETKICQSIGKETLYEAKNSFPRISTLHTYAKSIVHKYASLINYESDFSIPIEVKGELNLIIREVIEDINLDIDIDIFKGDLLIFQNTKRWKHNCSIPEEKRELSLDHFRNHLKFYNTIDFQGLVLYACEIILKRPSDFPPVFLQVDEYQDLNPVDQELISLASSNTGSEIVVVGDDAQSIYGFRNTNPEGIKVLWESEDWKHLHLTYSHRLPPHILRASQALIAQKNYLGGKINIPKDNGIKIQTLECTTSDLQIEAVAKEIKRIKSLSRNHGGKPLQNSDFMILCPTANFVSKVSKELKSKFTIPTRQREKKVIPEDHWRLLLVLRMLLNEDSLALRQWLEIIGIDPSTILKYRVKAKKDSVNLFSYCRNVSDGSILNSYKHLVELNNSKDDLESFKKNLLSFPYLNIENSLFSDVGVTINEITMKPNSIGKMIQTIHEKFGINEPDLGIPDDDSVLVSTMHSAKGLEADYVFILWLNKGFFPSSFRDQDEELRVFYVALTRAKQDVILTFHEKFVNFRLLKREAMSPFLKKINNHLNIKRVRKRDLK